MDQEISDIQVVWIDPQLDSQQNPAQLQTFRILGLSNLIGIKESSQLTSIIQKLKFQEKVVLICSSSVFKKVLDENLLKKKKIYPKVVIFCGTEDLAKKHKAQHADKLLQATSNDLVVVTTILNIKCDLEKENASDERKLSSKQYFEKLRKKNEEKLDRNEVPVIQMKNKQGQKVEEKVQEEEGKEKVEQKEQNLSEKNEQKSQKAEEDISSEASKEDQQQDEKSEKQQEKEDQAQDQEQEQSVNIPKRQEVEVEDKLSSNEDSEKDSLKSEESVEKSSHQENREKKEEEQNQSDQESSNKKNQDQQEKKQKLKGIWVDGNIKHNYHIIDRISQYINITSFDVFDEVLEFIEREIEAGTGDYVLIFANNMANSVLAIQKQHCSDEEEEENKPSCSNSLYPYENVQDYIIYCGNETIAYNILSQAGLEDQVFVTCEEAKLVKKIKQIHKNTFQND